MVEEVAEVTAVAVDGGDIFVAGAEADIHSSIGGGSFGVSYRSEGGGVEGVLLFEVFEEVGVEGILDIPEVVSVFGELVDVSFEEVCGSVVVSESGEA